MTQEEFQQGKELEKRIERLNKFLGDGQETMTINDMRITVKGNNHRQYGDTKTERKLELYSIPELYSEIMNVINTYMESCQAEYEGLFKD